MMECDGCKIRGNLQSSHVHPTSSVASQGNTFISEPGQLSDGLNNTSTIGRLFFRSLSPCAHCSVRHVLETHAVVIWCDMGSFLGSFLFWKLIPILRGLRKEGGIFSGSRC